VSEHFDLLLTHDVKVERETLLRIRHNLIAIPGAVTAEIDRVFSHPVALAQCRRFLALHPRMEAFAAYDTAGSVKQLVELRDRHAAAIASEAAAVHYGAQILEAGIEDNPENFTRFFLVRRAAESVADLKPNKISSHFPSRIVRLAGCGAQRTRGAGNQPDQDRVAAVHGKPWNTYSMWIARFDRLTRACGPWKRSAGIAPWSRNWAATKKRPGSARLLRPRDWRHASTKTNGDGPKPVPHFVSQISDP